MFNSPRYDYVMKELFRNETVLKYFIADVLDIPVDNIQNIHLKHTFLRKRYRNRKQGILDLIAELNDDIKINVELQIRMIKHWDKRQMYYLCRLYTDELNAGEDYSNLKRCVGISILDFNLSDRDEYHSVYLLRDAKGNVFSDTLEVHILELKKKLDNHEKVDDWIRFFNVNTEEDLAMIKTQNPGILEAIRELKHLNLENPLRLRYEAYLKRRRDQKAREEYVWDQGIAEGILQGEKQLVELQKRLLADNKMEDIKLIIHDEAARKRLYKEYGLSKAEDPGK